MARFKSTKHPVGRHNTEYSSSIITFGIKFVAFVEGQSIYSPKALEIYLVCLKPSRKLIAAWLQSSFPLHQLVLSDYHSSRTIQSSSSDDKHTSRYHGFSIDTNAPQELEFACRDTARYLQVYLLIIAMAT